MNPQLSAVRENDQDLLMDSPPSPTLEMKVQLMIRDFQNLPTPSKAEIRRPYVNKCFPELVDRAEKERDRSTATGTDTTNSEEQKTTLPPP